MDRKLSKHTNLGWNSSICTFSSQCRWLKLVNYGLFMNMNAILAVFMSSRYFPKLFPRHRLFNHSLFSSIFFIISQVRAHLFSVVEKYWSEQRKNKNTQLNDILLNKVQSWVIAMTLMLKGNKLSKFEETSAQMFWLKSSC